MNTESHGFSSRLEQIPRHGVVDLVVVDIGDPCINTLALTGFGNCRKLLYLP